MAAFALTAGLVADASGGHLVGGSPDRVFAAVSTDSRSLPSDALFVALAGPNFDGHAYVDEVVARGAAGVLVSTLPSHAGAAAIVRVDDTLAALQRMARVVRRRSGARVVAITGSAGKTTTKEVAADFLSARYRVFRNQGNLNNHIGLPLSLLELRGGPDIAVVELGMNHAGEIRTLVDIAEPDVRVWINVGDAHLGHFSSRASIAKAKAEILEGATSDQLLVANADDPLVMAHAHEFAGRRTTFGEQAHADVRATGVIDRGFDGTEADVDTSAGRVHLTVPLAGRVQLSNVLAAIAVAIEFDVPLSEVRERAGNLRAVSRRGAMSELPNGARLVDDSYNASPSAVRAMLAALKATATPGRRIAVLGEMLELGETARALHWTCGNAAATTVDELVVIGGAPADGFAEGAIEGGLSSSRVHRFSSSSAAIVAVQDLVRAGDLVLVKGSRGTRTDLIADALRGDA